MFNWTQEKIKDSTHHTWMPYWISFLSLTSQEIWCCLPDTQEYSASRKDISSLGQGCIFCRVSSWMSRRQLCFPEHTLSRWRRTSAEQPTCPWSSFIHLPKCIRPNLAPCINKTSSTAQVALNFSFEQYSPFTEKTKKWILWKVLSSEGKKEKNIETLLKCVSCVLRVQLHYKTKSGLRSEQQHFFTF